MTTNESDMIHMVMWELKRYSEAPRLTLKRSLKIWALEDSETFSNNFLDPGVRWKRLIRSIRIRIQLWRWKQKGRDILYDIDLSLEDVLKGKKDEIELPKMDSCTIATEPAPSRHKATKMHCCNGQGQTRRVYSQNRFSTFVSLEPCSYVSRRG